MKPRSMFFLSTYASDCNSMLLWRPFPRATRQRKSKSSQRSQLAGDSKEREREREREGRRRRQEACLSLPLSAIELAPWKLSRAQFYFYEGVFMGIARRWTYHGRSSLIKTGTSAGGEGVKNE